MKSCNILYISKFSLKSARTAFNMPLVAAEDVEMNLTELGNVKMGEDFEIRVTVKVRKGEARGWLRD